MRVKNKNFNSNKCMLPKKLLKRYDLAVGTAANKQTNANYVIG